MSFTQHPRSDFADETLTSRFNTTAPISSERPQQTSRKMPEHTKDEAGVIEAYPGIIESTDIDPLHHESNKDKSGQSYLSAATDMAASAAKYVYSSATGDEAGKRAGKEGLWGSAK